MDSFLQQLLPWKKLLSATNLILIDFTENLKTYNDTLEIIEGFDHIF